MFPEDTADVILLRAEMDELRDQITGLMEENFRIRQYCGQISELFAVMSEMPAPE